MPDSKEEFLELDGRTVKLTRPDKVLWPDEGYTKRDLVNYYRMVAAFILPYLKDRPLTLHRHPNGIKAPAFFQTDVTVERLKLPDWMQTAKVRDFGDEPEIDCAMCQDEASLVYLANLACIELNPWNARSQTLEFADYVHIDLDPLKIGFDAVIEAAQVTREVFEENGAKCFCKTSGGRGLHIVAPLAHARYTHDQAKDFAHLVATMVQARLPKTTSIDRMPAKRNKKVYLDYMQNGRGKTLVVAYSVRPRSGAGVSTPLHWEEVKKGLDPTAWNIKTIQKRIRVEGDLWRPVLKDGFQIEEFLDRLEKRSLSEEANAARQSPSFEKGHKRYSKPSKRGKTSDKPHHRPARGRPTHHQ